MGGDWDVYRGVVKIYMKDIPELLAKLRGLSSETLADYAIAVHGLKSSSRNIGAEELGSKAEELELAAKAGNFAFVQANNGKLLQMADALLAGLAKRISDA